MRISDWSSVVCSSDLERFTQLKLENAYRVKRLGTARAADAGVADLNTALDGYAGLAGRAGTPEEYDLALAMAREDVDRAVRDGRSEERRGGEEGVRKCMSRGWPYT